MPASELLTSKYYALYGFLWLSSVVHKTCSPGFNPGYRTPLATLLSFCHTTYHMKMDVPLYIGVMLRLPFKFQHQALTVSNLS
mmetsp:Transcript_23389/g.79578  ORF Transcript_23389/g.79578 Transcript_23389/m.79578 type:complete len:83 (+) Transcript_23389:890-1138(+)